MTVKDLIKGLESQACPDAEVYFIDESGSPLPVHGGLLDVEEGSGRQGMLLAGVSFSGGGGF